MSGNRQPGQKTHNTNADVDFYLYRTPTSAPPPARAETVFWTGTESLPLRNFAIYGSPGWALILVMNAFPEDVLKFFQVFPRATFLTRRRRAENTAPPYAPIVYSNVGVPELSSLTWQGEEGLFWNASFIQIEGHYAMQALVLHQT